jgi:hypothetical protein
MIQALIPKKGPHAIFARLLKELLVATAATTSAGGDSVKVS